MDPTPEAPRLIGGPYRPPRARVYRSSWYPAQDRIRGEVRTAGISDAPIPWPLGRTRGQSKPTPIVTRQLERAIRTESVEAIAYWWGVSRWTVRRWRVALGVGRYDTEGTRARWRELAPLKLTPAVRAKALRHSNRTYRRRRAEARAAARAALDHLRGGSPP